MKIHYVWHTFNIAEAISTLVPFKPKKYVKKFGKACPNDIHKVFIEHDCQGNLKATLIQRCNIIPLSVPSPIYVYGISMQDLWDNMLEILAKFKNMRNTEEFCIWLDMKDI